MDARERFEGVYAAHAGAVRTFARRRADAATADDVVAEVFLAAWRRFDELPADPLPWLIGVARGVLANHRRGGDRRAALVVRLTHEEVSAGVATLDEPDLGVIEALAGLSERDREVLLLVAWEGFSQEQVAATLGVARGTVAVRLFRARRRFARALDAQDTVMAAAAEPSSQVEVS